MSRAGIMRRIDSIGGTAAPGLVSVLYAHAKPRVLHCSQYDGGSQPYGPVTFMPVACAKVTGLALAVVLVGDGHTSCPSA